LPKSLEFLTLSFAALLPLVNPLGSALIFLGMVGNAGPGLYRRLARRIALNTVLFIAIVAFAGSWILKFFGISLPVVQLAGGLTLAAMGWRGMSAPVTETAAESANPASEEAVMMQQAFYPFTFPLTVGPGVMVVVLTLSAHAARPTWQGTLLAHAGILVASGLLAILVYLCYGNAPRLQRLLPPSVSAGVLRLMSFVLLCIGAQIAWEGLDLLLKSTGH